MPAAEPAPLTGGRLLLAAFTLALANFVVVLDTTIANVSVPHIAGGLAVSPNQGTWTITSYAVADAIMVPLSGWLSARFGSVRWFMVSLAGFGIFSFLCGTARTLEMLVVFRVLQGLSGGPLMPLSQTLLLRIFPRDKAPAAFGIWAMTTTIAPILGPILGGQISDNWSWPWIFFINLPVVALCLFGVARMIVPHETPTEKKPIDVVGLVLLVIWVGAFQIMLDTGRDHDWFGSVWIVELAVVSAVGLVAFIIWEMTDAHPVVDVRIFRHRGFACAGVALPLAFGAFFASVVLTPLWLQQVIGYTATNAGYVVAWVGLLAVLFSPIAARLVGKIDIRITVSAGILWLGAMSLLRAHWTTGVDYWDLVIPHLLQGAGMPFFFIGVTALALGSVPQSEIVSAAGLISFLRTLSGAVATAIATTMWDDAATTARSELTGQLNGVADVIEKLKATGMAHEQARAAVDRLVEAQAATVGAMHVYIAMALAFVLAALLVWFIPRVRSQGMIAAH